EQLPFPQDGGRQRRAQVHPALETRTGPDEDISRRANAPEPLVGEPAPPALGWYGVRNENQDIEVTVGPSVAACLGAEKVDPLRLVSIGQALDDARKRADVLFRQVGQLAANPVLKSVMCGS